MQGWSKSISNSLSLDSSIYFIGNEPENIREDLLCISSDDALDLIKKEIESNSPKLLLIDHPLTKRGKKTELFNKFINICDIYNVKCKRYYIVISPINVFLNN